MYFLNNNNKNMFRVSYQTYLLSEHLKEQCHEIFDQTFF